MSATTLADRPTRTGQPVTIHDDLGPDVQQLDPNGSMFVVHTVTGDFLVQRCGANIDVFWVIRYPSRQVMVDVDQHMARFITARAALAAVPGRS